MKATEHGAFGQPAGRGWGLLAQVGETLGCQTQGEHQRQASHGEPAMLLAEGSRPGLPVPSLVVRLLLRPEGSPAPGPTVLLQRSKAAKARSHLQELGTGCPWVQGYTAHPPPPQTLSRSRVNEHILFACCQNGLRLGQGQVPAGAPGPCSTPCLS